MSVGTDAQAYSHPVTVCPECCHLTTCRIAQDGAGAVRACSQFYPSPEGAVRLLLRTLGEDPERNGLLDTPRRVVKALREMTSGYNDNPATILERTFEEDSDELVLLRGIRFTSLCEHHMLPFTGVAYVGYLPGKVVGISKLARLVECFARRLQIQERMTNQIASAIETHLGAQGVGVILQAHHQCMGCRGVRQPDAAMVTSSMLGVLRTSEAARAEFLTLCGLR